MKKNVLQMFIGLILGLIVPVLFCWLFMVSFYSGSVPLVEVFRAVKSSALLIKLLFIALLPNLLAVFLLNHFELWNFCRGVFISIMIYIAVAVLAY
jgi:hypothetical protein